MTNSVYVWEKNKNKKKNYYRKSVKVSLWAISVGIQQ